MEEAPTLTEDLKPARSSATPRTMQYLTVEDGDQPSPSKVDWKDPDIDTMATYLQAGYKGMKTRELEESNNQTCLKISKTEAEVKAMENSPEIVVKQATESEEESEYTYTYVEEDEEDESEESLNDKPTSPETALQEINIAGFKASALIGSWLHRRKKNRPIALENEDDSATKIQAGYRGMIAREKMRELEKSRGEKGDKLILPPTKNQSR